MTKRWIVQKFGGTSLADAAAYRRVAEILIQGEVRPQAVVVSAMSGVTDALIGLVAVANTDDGDYHEALQTLSKRVVGIVYGLLPTEAAKELETGIESDLEDIGDLLRAIRLIRFTPAPVTDLVSGYGEVWSARLLAAHLVAMHRPARWLDAREVLIVRQGEIAPAVDWETTRSNLDSWIHDANSELIVVTGFVAKDTSGATTTLGRNGSDYSASIFGALLGAESITLWTDVDGVLSANPRQVSEAQVLPHLSYDEAMELAYFGAKVVHPRTMAPAIESAIPIHIRNTFNPAAPGTEIHTRSDGENPVKGFATIEGIALINLEGSGLIGVPGIAERVFGAIGKAGVSVVLISQGSSEHSICFAVPEDQAERAKSAVDHAFYAERHQGQVQSPTITKGCAVLAAVGDAMAGAPGVSGRFFGALAKAGINVRAIAQGSSERNISAVIDQAASTRAVRAVHSGFYLSNQTLSIGLVGPGLVGSTLLGQIGGQIERLRSELGVDLRIRGIADSSRMMLDDREISLERWRDRLTPDMPAVDLERFVDHVDTDTIPHAVIIDCTASRQVAMRYGDWLARGIHVITPNKLANSADLDYYRRLRTGPRDTKMHYLYETTVGAGLPIIQTLRDLIQTGDEILQIEGILSGTLSYLFNSFDGKRPFSEIVREARINGYTEPDPREDLSGRDVARKVLILAREMGLEISIDDLEIQSLVPAELQEGSVDQFLDRLGRFDQEMAQLVETARERNEVLRFVGLVSPTGKSSVRLTPYPQSHPFARINLTDNIVQFTSRRYADNPLVVQGPGAGTEVTAAGVFADLLRLAAYLGAAF